MDPSQQRNDSVIFVRNTQERGHSIDHLRFGFDPGSESHGRPCLENWPGKHPDGLAVADVALNREDASKAVTLTLTEHG